MSRTFYDVKKRLLCMPAFKIGGSPKSSEFVIEEDNIMIAIQWEDVIGVLQTCAPYLIALGVLWIIAVIVMIACRN